MTLSSAASSGRPAGALPNLIVIGAQKCGTSALHYYLGLHPEVQMSSPKELSFFLAEDDLETDPFIEAPEELRLAIGARNWSRGEDWYASHFRGDAPVRGEATPGYASPWFPGVAGRMAAVVPGAKLIFLARDPLERIVAHYEQNRDSGREWRPLGEALERPDNVYVGRSRYALALRPFLDRFPRERVLILRQEDLLLRRRETMRRVFAFLEVEQSFWSSKMERERHPTAGRGRRYRAFTRLQGSRLAAPLYRLPPEAKWVLERVAYVGRSRHGRPALEPRLRSRLAAQLEPEIEAFERLTGWDLDDWRAT